MNTQRNAALDAAKGISLLSLPVIHSALMYGKPEIRDTKTGCPLAFIAEHAGANVFLLTMGISIALGKPKSSASIIGRAAQLLLQGYGLNFLKFIVPGILGWLPGRMLEDNGLPKGKDGLKQLLLTGDVLQLAALSQLACGFIRKSKQYRMIALFAAAGVVFGSPAMWKQSSSRLLTGEPPRAFFPVFPWMAYPLYGLAIGAVIKHQTARGYCTLGASSVLVLLLTIRLGKKENSCLKENFYRQGPSGTLQHLASAGLFVSLCGAFQPGRFLSLLSRNVTSNYMIQWVLVFWLMPLFGYAKLNMRKCVQAGSVNTMLTVLLTYCFDNCMMDKTNSCH